MGIHLEAHLPNGATVATINAAFRDGVTAQGVDYRIRIPRWMREFQLRGGDIQIEDVDEARLDAIASEYDITLLPLARVR